MRLQFLTHLLEAVAALARPRRILVLGSSSLLPQHPQLGDTGHLSPASLPLSRWKAPANINQPAIAYRKTRPQ